MIFRQFACVAGLMCAKFHAGTKVCTQNFRILAKISFSARAANKIRLES